MRPSSRTETALWRRIDRWRNTQRWRPTQTQIAEELGLSTSTLSEWKYGDSVPSHNNLEALSEMTGIAFTELAGLVQEVVQARRTPTGKATPGQRRRRELDQVGEESQDAGPNGG